MTTLPKSLLWVLSLGLIAGGTWSVLAQEGKKQEMSKEERAKAHTEHMAAFHKAFTGSKTTLTQAIAAAETQGKGKAFDAEMELGKDKKLTIDVMLFVGEKVVKAVVDPETGKVTKTEEHKDNGDEEEDGD